MTQTYTSAATSINSAKLPRIFAAVNLPGFVVLDYGSGRYTEHILQHVNAQGSAYYPYDPYNQPDDVNTYSRKYVRLAHVAGVPTVAILSNVLNVIQEDDVVIDIVNDALTLTGDVLISIYEGDRTGNGRQTGPDQYQRNEKKAAYITLLRAHGLKANKWHSFIRVTA